MEGTAKEFVPRKSPKSTQEVSHASCSQLNLSFLIQIALGHAPQQVRNIYQNAFLTFANVLLRQRQLSSTRFACCVTNFGKDTEDLLENICTNLKLERKGVDPDRGIWVAAEVFSKFFIRPGQWVNLCKFSGGTCKADKGRRRKNAGSDELCFTCQIFPIPQQMQQCQQRVIVINSVAEYNLRKSLNILPYLSIPDLQLKPLVTDPVLKTSNKSLSFSPIQGKSVKLTRLKCSYEILENECDILISDEFQINDKYLCVGDIISFPVQNDNASLDLVVTEINEKLVEHDCKEVFRVSSEVTRLVVNQHELYNQFHLRADSNIIKRLLLPPCLEERFSKLQEWIRQTLISNHVKSANSSSSTSSTSDWWPNFLVYGPIGSGKTTVCRAVSAFYGFNFHFINGVNLIGDTSAYTEGKFRAMYDQIKGSLCPAFVYIKNLHLVGKDKDGSEDKRVILAFKEFLKDIASLSTIPTSRNDLIMTSNAVIVMGSTSYPEQLVPAITQNFVFKLELSPVINSIIDTEATLKWFMEKAEVDLDKGVSLAAWVKENCEGMKRSYGDLKALMSDIVRYAFSRTKNSECGITLNRLVVNVDDLNYGLKTIDAILKKAASTVEIPKINWDDIGGMEDIKQELINSIRLPLEYPHLFAAGIRRSGILLYGPPGTGKTLIAKAVATEFKLSFLSVKGPELLNMYVGQSEQNVRDVFAKARNVSPCIIFFDELDALAPNRGRSGDSGGVMDRVVSQILAELDGTHSTLGVFIIGATNRPDLIDPALLRPGRFDRLLYVGINQDVDSKTSVLKALTRKFRCNEDVNLTNIATMLPNGMSGADLYSLCSDTYMIAVERHISKILDDQYQQENQNAETSSDIGVEINMHDFEIAICRATASLSEVDQIKYEAMKKMTR